MVGKVLRMGIRGKWTTENKIYVRRVPARYKKEIIESGQGDMEKEDHQTNR